MTRVQVQKLHTLTGHRDAVYTLAPSSVPNIFFSAGGDGMVVQWDLSHPNEGESIANVPNSIYALKHLTDDLLVAGQNYEGIHLLDWKRKKEVASLKLSPAAIFDIQATAKELLVGTGEGIFWVIDREAWTIRTKVHASEKSVRSIAVNPLQGEVAVGYSDFFIRVFDLESGRLKKEWQAHQNSIFTLVYSPDYKILLSGSRDARLKAWICESEYQLGEEVVAHLYAINHIVFSPDSKHFVTCSMDKSIKVWDAEELRLLKVIDKTRHAGHGTSVNKLLWTSFNSQLVSASDDRTLSVWHLIF